MFKLAFSFFFLLQSGLLLVPCIGETQTTLFETFPAISLPGVTVTASRQEQASFDTPRSVAVIGQEEIERRTPVVLADLLRGEAGVFEGQLLHCRAIIRGRQGARFPLAWAHKATTALTKFVVKTTNPSCNQRYRY